MTKVVVGSIPDKISYVYSKSINVKYGCVWDIDYFDDNGLSQKVTPAFPVESGDEKALKKAIEWASDGKKSHIIKEIDNKDITDIKVISVETRGNGGRAYKAIVDGFYVDLREDVMMDTLLQLGIKPGGVLNGTFVWAKIGPHMKIVRVGSELHRLIKEYEKSQTIKPIAKNELEVGGIYENRKKNRFIFLGYINTVRFSYQKPEGGYYLSHNQQKDNVDFNFTQTPIKKGFLFKEIYSYEAVEKAAPEAIKDFKSRTDFKYSISFAKSHSLINKIDQIKLPDNIITQLRNSSLAEIKDKILEYLGKKQPRNNYARIDAANLKEHIAYQSEFLNLFEYGKDPVEVFDVTKYINFS